MESEREIEQIKAIIETMGRRYHGKGGEVTFAGIEGSNTVKIAPAGFCWH